MSHRHRLPATPEEWADAFAASMGVERCTKCRRELTPALSLTSMLEVAESDSGLRGLLLEVRREYGPWAAVCLCLRCGDVAVWPISPAEREALARAAGAL